MLFRSAMSSATARNLTPAKRKEIAHRAAEARRAKVK
jgi:hypothetical protein